MEILKRVLSRFASPKDTRTTWIEEIRCTSLRPRRGPRVLIAARSVYVGSGKLYAMSCTHRLNECVLGGQNLQGVCLFSVDGLPAINSF